MKQIIQFEGLYGESTPRPVTETLFAELLETRSRTFNWVVQPHIHTRLFQLFYLNTGEVLFQDATRAQTLPGPCVLLIPPTALHGFTFSADATGHILSLSSAFVDDLFSATPALITLLNTVHCLTTFDPPYSAATVLGLIQEIATELFADQPEKQSMLHACLHRLFLILYRLLEQNQATKAEALSPMLPYFRRFQRLLRQADTPKTITYLAGELAITPVHLNRICRAVAQKSASQLVQEHVIHEAHKYLTYTAYSVSEIAYLLHFEYPNYFARFFKKQTGQSPSEYREQQRDGV